VAAGRLYVTRVSVRLRRASSAVIP
jgi:hypothetical protein